MLTHSLIQYLTLPATPPSPVALAAGVRFIHKARLYEREIKDSLLLQAQVHTHILSVLVLIRTPLRLVHMDIPSPLTLLVTRKTPSKTSHLTIL